MIFERILSSISFRAYPSLSFTLHVWRVKRGYVSVAVPVHPTTPNHIDNLGLTAAEVVEEQDGELDGVQKTTLQFTLYKPYTTALRIRRSGRHSHVLSGHAAKGGSLNQISLDVGCGRKRIGTEPYLLSREG